MTTQVIAASHGNHHSTSSSSHAGTATIGQHFRVGKKIGEGSFGVVFEGVNVLNGAPVAIKFEPRKSDAPQLRDEYRSYRILNGCNGIPQVHYFGQEGLHNVLVIDLFGPNLEDLFDMCARKFSVKTVCMLAKQMLSRVQSVHDKHLIYRDIKPDNFLIGAPGTRNANLIHLIDFGMAKHYRDPRSHTHIPYRERKSLSGTARYMSINTHLGREQSRRDDLESLGHVFLYFLRGGLPWQGLKAATNKQKYEKIGQKKESTAIPELCENFPDEFAIYMNYVRKLGFEESPDYDFLRSLFAKVLDARGETDDGQFDWMALNGGRGWEVGNTPSAHLAQAHAQAQTPHRARRHRTDRERERDREARREREREKERERLANDSNASPSTPGGGLTLPSPAVKKPNRHDRLAIGENTPTGGASVNPIAPMSRRASGLDTSPRSNLALNGTIGVDRLNVNTTHPYASAPHSGTGADGRPLSTLQNATSGSNNNNKPLPSPFPTTNGNGTATGSGSPERSEGRQYRAVEGMRIENDGSRRSRGLGGDDDRHSRKKNAFAMCCR